MSHCTTETDCTKSTPYYIAKQKKIHLWEKRLDNLFTDYARTFAPSLPFSCIECGCERPEVLLRCLECGPLYQGCEDCIIKAHKHRPYHFIEQWKVCIYLYLDCAQICVELYSRIRTCTSEPAFYHFSYDAL